MNLKPRPMAEAPLNERLLLFKENIPEAVGVLENETIKAVYLNYLEGFILISDLLRAAEILAAITPDGYEYDEASGGGESVDKNVFCRHVYFRRIAPPVEYEYVTDGKLRERKVGDFILRDGEFFEVVRYEFPTRPEVCYRRAEVKR